jgi:hypothetical protein
MEFFDDTRGISPVIGVIFLFAFLVIAISINQAQVVPAENADVEFAHNQEVQNDLIDARSAIVEASYPQRDGTVAVELGTGYPARAIGVNPGPASGRLRTTANAELVVENASATRVDVCVGDSSVDETRRLRYEPNYNEYTPPTTVYENTFLYNQQGPDGSVGESRLTEAALAFTSPDNNGTINLIALKNPYSEEGVNAVSVEFISGETQRSDGASNDGVQDPTITLPTGVENQQIWQTIVTRVNAKDQVGATIDSFTPGTSVTISFTGQYDILCTPVGVGGEPPSGAGAASLQGPATGGTGGGGPIPGITATASDLPAGSNGVTQTITFSPENATIPSGETISIDLSDPNGGTSGNPDPVKYGDGSVTVDYPQQNLNIIDNGGTYIIEFTPSTNLPPSKTVEVEITNVKTQSSDAPGQEAIVARSDGGDTTTSFDVGSGGGSGGDTTDPDATIDDITSSQTGGPNPKYKLRIDWSASDNNDLSGGTVEVRLVDTSGGEVESEDRDPSGTSASGTVNFNNLPNDPSGYTVEVIVTDAAGNTDRDTETV